MTVLLQTIISLVSAVISAAIATIMTIIITYKREALLYKKQLVDDLFRYRYQLTDYGKNSNDSGLIETLSRVPVVFDRNSEVLKKYDELYNTLLITDELERDIKSNEALKSFLKSVCKASHIKCELWNDSRFERVFTHSVKKP